MSRARPRGTDSARLITVIETVSLRGTGTDETDMCRPLRQYWDLKGNLLAENDPCEKEKCRNELPEEAQTVH